MALLLLVRPEVIDASTVITASDLVMHGLVLVAAGLIYLHWRLSASQVAAWLTLVVLATSAPHLALVALLVADPAAAARGRWWVVVTMTLLAALLLAATLAARKRVLPVDPLTAGLVLGVAFSVLAFTLVRWAPVITPPEALKSSLGLLPTLLVTGLVGFHPRNVKVPTGVRLRVLLGLGLLTLAQSSHHAVLSIDLGPRLHVALCGAGTGLLCFAALEMVRMSIRGQRSQVRLLYTRLLAAESAAREHRARLHEIGSTVAGITSVSRLVYDPRLALLPAHRRSLLEGTMTAELERLERLMSGDAQAPRNFRVYDVLSHLVVAHRAQGGTVICQPGAHAAIGRPDDLAEAVHVLFDNSAKHGASRVSLEVEVERDRGLLQIVVSDDGPGIHPELRERIFDWGAQGPDSCGQGIGLAIARQLVEHQGGSLRLDDSQQGGTRFVIELLAGESRDDVEQHAG